MTLTVVLEKFLFGQSITILNITAKDSASFLVTKRAGLTRNYANPTSIKARLRLPKDCIELLTFASARILIFFVVSMKQ